MSKEYYSRITGEPFITTIDSDNRDRDSIRLFRLYPFLLERGDENILLMTERKMVIAKGYIRVLFGDHGPYLELDKVNLSPYRDNWYMSKKKGRHAWYDECLPVDGSNCLLYVQRKTVNTLPNPPAGSKSFSNNRKNGYADYRIGRFYIDPELVRYSKK